MKRNHSFEVYTLKNLKLGEGNEFPLIIELQTKVASDTGSSQKGPEVTGVDPQCLTRTVFHLNLINTALIIIEKLLVTHLHGKGKYHHNLSSNSKRGEMPSTPPSLS